MKNIVIFLPLFVFLFCVNNVYAEEKTLEGAIDDLAKQIAESTTSNKKLLVAVLDFGDTQGSINVLGRFVAEELTTRLFLTRKFNVVERSLLNKALQELNFNLTDLVDASRARQLGKIVAAENIVTGSITDLGPSVSVNARVIDVETGQIIGVGRTQIAKDKSVEEMIRKTVTGPSMSSVKEKPSEMKTEQQSQPGEVFFKEDFSSVQEGMMPKGWLGGEKMMVKSDGKRNFLTDFETQGKHRVTISDVKFPENFELKCTFNFGLNISPGVARSHNIAVLLYLGNITVEIIGDGSYRINESTASKRQDHRDRLVQAVLKKEGDIFKLYINGEEVLMGRYSDFRTPAGFSFELINITKFKLIEIAGTAL